MSVIKGISRFFGAKPIKDGFNSTALFNTADMTMSILNDMFAALQVPVFALDIATAVTDTDPRSHHKKFLTGAAYESMMKHAPLNWVKYEDKNPLGTLINLTEDVIKDLRVIMENFREYFPDEEVVDDDFKMSHLVISGYIRCASEFSKWLSAIFLIRDTYNASGGRIETSSTPAKYLVQTIQKTQPYTDTLVKEVFHRANNTDFGKLLASLKIDSKDIVVASKKIDITIYAEDSQYHPTELKYATLGMINPFQWVSQRRAIANKLQYERNKELRVWIRARVNLLEKKQSGLDPLSPEYTHFETVINNYVAMIATYDKKIQQYEV